MKKIYIYNNIEYDEIPSFYWPNSSPITEAFFILKGGRIEEREDIPEGTEEYDEMIGQLCKTNTFANALMKCGKFVEFWNAPMNIKHYTTVEWVDKNGIPYRYR